jgi:hypothetical protein
MPGTNDFLSFAGGGSANVLTQVAYAALTSELANGFTSGTAQSTHLNKVWRQASIMAAVLAQFIVDETGNNAVDDGTTATLLANLKTAVAASVISQGLASSGIQSFTSTGSLPTSIAGGTCLINSASATVQTLPAASAVALGRQVEFLNIGAGVGTVQKVGSDTITINNTTVTALALGNGDTLTVESNGVNGWIATGGSAKLASSGVYAASMAAPGYQKLPSGLIMQWGLTAAIATGATGAVTTYPIAYPNASWNVVATFSDAASLGTSTPCNVTNLTTTGFTTTHQRGSNAQFLWFAIGN